MKSIKKRITVLTVVIVLVLSQLSFASAVEADYAGHWAQPVIEKWYNYGIVKGYSNGSFKPDNVVTRAEFVTMLNSLFGFVEEDTNIFNDVSGSDWFYHNVNKGATAGIIKGSNSMFRPLDKITRQEAAVVLERAFKLSAENEYAYTQFNDRDVISNWAIQSVNALVESSYMNGRGNSELAPLANLTRAEAITLISNIAGDIIQQPSTVTGTYNGNLFVNEADVVIKDTTIKGNLYIAEGVGEGDITLDNVKVLGELVVLGGGENSIIINNSDIGSLVVIKIGGKIRILAEGDTIVGHVQMLSGGKLQEENLNGEGTGFGGVEILIVKPGEPLVLDGDFDKVTIEASVDSITIENGSVGELVLDGVGEEVHVTVADTGSVGILDIENANEVVLCGDFGKIDVDCTVEKLTLENGTVGTMVVSEDAEGSGITLSEEVIVETMEIDATVAVSGTGTVEEAVVNADDVSFDEAPEDISGTADSVAIGIGEETEEVELEQPIGGGGFGGGGTVAPTTVDLAVVFSSGTANQTLTLEVEDDADGYEIGKVFLNFIVNNFDTFYDDVNDAILGNDGMFLIDALTFFEYAEAEDLSGTVYDSLPLKSGAEYTPAEKKDMLEAVLLATADNLTDTNVVKNDMIKVAEAVDFSSIKYDGYNFKSLEIRKDNQNLATFTQGGDKEAFITAVMDPLLNINPSTTVKYEMIIILDDGNDTTKTSTFETL